MGIKFGKDTLAVEQNNYLIKILNLLKVNTHIVYELDTWLKISLNNFKIKICLIGVTNIAKHSDKEK